MIKAKSLSFNYPDGTEALRDINLEVRDGEFLALMGANGSGKTTLLKLALGLLNPTSGRIALGEREFPSLKDKEVFKHIGMIFQDPNDQLFAATVGQDVSFGVANLGLRPAEVSDRVDNAMRMVGISGLFNKAIHTLSFGQKRRAAIAGVLAMSPKIILLDEPTSGLDPHGVSVIMRLLCKLNKENQITMVMATHDVELVPIFCDRIVIMEQGRIMKEGTPQEIFSDATTIRKAKLRLPRIAHLMEVLQKEDGLALSEVPLTIDAARRELLKLVKKQT